MRSAKTDLGGSFSSTGLNGFHFGGASLGGPGSFLFKTDVGGRSWDGN